MPRSITLRRTALLSAMTAFAIPEMHAQPSDHVHQIQQPDRHVIQAAGLNGDRLRAIQLEPTQRWVF